ncbi:hypothetical protein N7451_011572 [Penicillium sp. IBT 35674x]|nr:hypothetical protein N7451_011572 [Penicillium sp. IBT 35674x]
MSIVAPRTDDDKMIKFIEEELSLRTDELYRVMVRHQTLSMGDDDRRKGLLFLPSSRAFTPFEAKSRPRGDYIREGDWDRNRDAEIAVWRAMKDLDAIETECKAAKGYWVKTDVLDMFPWEGMRFF